MTTGPTFLQLLRQERHPLAILAAFAMVLRVTVLLVSLSISPSVAADGLGLLCQPSAESGQSLPRGGQHDPAHCICGPACHHAGQFHGAPASAHTLIENVKTASSFEVIARSTLMPAVQPSGDTIRGPPRSLI